MSDLTETIIELLRAHASGDAATPDVGSSDTGVDEILDGADPFEAHAALARDLAPGYVPSEGRTVERPAPSPSTTFADFLRRGMGYAQ
ncbi:hypothetical protein C0J29_00105 [Mycobacterium paragordonae]|uniref:Uncharacterized protein n=1 Tax=Mycobacterium paragordonae TaxID=1389713 RepID=A0ABQ1CD14_9MYCO|nr:hypothetical protein [Mycobacterium paragordonae]AYE93453.1 hypothetical protein C0J29_00105 [Mycobacterium paragordonae]GFG82309.1 hypothetical protein MPRG_55850 [Mycobacterium paragordonae]